MTYPTDYLNKIITGDCLEVLKTMPDSCVDSIVTDPPAGIGFMGKEWDSDKGGKDEWIAWLGSVMAEGLRVLKPGGHALVWALPRTSHWTGTALENAGFEVRDCVYHLFGSGFPKSLDISKAIDKQAGKFIEGEETENSRKGVVGDDGNFNHSKRVTANNPQTPEAKQWEGWGTALKPAVECWWLVRKPLGEKTVAENVLKWGVGGLNIDGSRVGLPENTVRPVGKSRIGTFQLNSEFSGQPDKGRFPSHLIHDGSDVIVNKFPNVKGELHNKQATGDSIFLGERAESKRGFSLKDEGSAARFFYSAKPSSSEKNLLYGEFEEKEKYSDFGLEQRVENGKATNERTNNQASKTKNFHPTVKAQSLMSYLIKLITPPKGIVLDMFAGSGSTLLAAKNLGHPYIGIEIDPEYVKIAEGRLKQGVLPF